MSMNCSNQHKLQGCSRADVCMYCCRIHTCLNTSSTSLLVSLLPSTANLSSSSSRVPSCTSTAQHSIARTAWSAHLQYASTAVIA
jgi:hypothetical protein